MLIIFWKGFFFNKKVLLKLERQMDKIRFEGPNINTVKNRPKLDGPNTLMSLVEMLNDAEILK